MQAESPQNIIVLAGLRYFDCELAFTLVSGAEKQGMIEIDIPFLWIFDIDRKLLQEINHIDDILKYIVHFPVLNRSETDAV